MFFKRVRSTSIVRFQQDSFCQLSLKELKEKKGSVMKIFELNFDFAYALNEVI